MVLKRREECVIVNIVTKEARVSKKASVYVPGDEKLNGADAAGLKGKEQVTSALVKKTSMGMKAIEERIKESSEELAAAKKALKECDEYRAVKELKEEIEECRASLWNGVTILREYADGQMMIDEIDK